MHTNNAKVGELVGSIPETLKASDVTAIRRASFSVLFDDADGDPSLTKDWINTATGSSGEVVARDAADRSTCKGFETTVTSLSGVHHYSGTLCPDGKTAQMWLASS